jgi:hypothetical protein
MIQEAGGQFVKGKNIIQTDNWLGVGGGRGGGGVLKKVIKGSG